MDEDTFFAYTPVVMTTLTCCTLMLAASFYIVRQRRQMKEVGQVARLFLYPIKSCAGVEVTSAECTTLGLKSGHMRDRAFAVLKDGTFVNALDFIKMALITPSFQDDCMTVTAPDSEPLTISISDLESQNLEVVSFSYRGIEMQGYDCGQTCAEWMQRCLGSPDLRLVYFGKGLKPGYSYQKLLVGQLMRKTDMMCFSYTTSYMLMCDSSVSDLNLRVDQPVPIMNFRSNIVVKNDIPYDEERWSLIKLGNDAMLRNLRLCQRCPRININAETGEMHPKEPLNTLRRYHLSKDKNLNKISKAVLPVIGVNLGIDKVGTVKIGDPVYAAFK